jgi:four helix bundle protein
VGTPVALLVFMGVKRLEDLVAFQQAVAFKLEVYAVVQRHSTAQRDFRYRDQLFDAASSVEANIAEGWRRFSAIDMIRFLRYAAGSLEEARVRLLDGVARGYFGQDACQQALEHAARCSAATTGLARSLGRLAQGRR